MKIMKPILFSTPMVRAILEGRKTMTRRIIKPQPTNPRWNNIGFLGWDDGHGYEIKCPYEIGMVLWVRETWQLLPSGFEEIPPEMNYIYKATDELSEECTKWRPSIFMPRKAARIFLEVKNVRVERLQDITEEDAFEEGISIDEVLAIPASITARNLFEALWDGIYQWPNTWESNPWVWVIEFERC